MGAAIALKMLASIAIQLRPTPTPIAVSWLLTSRWRRWYRNPTRTLDLIGLEPGMRVLELGAGTGLFSTEARRRLGVSGKLICCDLQRGMLRALQQQVHTAGLTDVHLQAATAEQLPLADSCIDLVFAIAVLPMLYDKNAALVEIRRVLRPGGVLAVSEELAEPEYVPAWLIKRWCRWAGFDQTDQTHTFWWYVLRFRR